MAIYDYQGNELYSGQNMEPQENDIPIVTITGTLPSAKSEGEIPVVLTYNSISKQFESYATVKVQGDSSTTYPKKNFTIKLYSDEERTAKDKHLFRDWDKKRNKFVLKANWIDHSHARNIVNARLWRQIVKSRSDYADLPEELKNGNAAVDGFPVKVFNNGVYMGLYTWNLPKDALYGLDDEIDTNAIVQSDSGQGAAVLWRASSMSGKWADEIHDEMPAAITTGFDTLLNFVYTSSDTDYVANFSTHFDKTSVIDQYIFIYLACMVDQIGKNQTFFTYDAVNWFGGMYDMDGTWGLPPWQITGWKSTDTAFQSGYNAVVESGGTTNLFYERLANNFSADILARYQELRAGVLSADNICAEFDRFMSNIPPYLYEEDYASTTGGGAFTDIPLKTTNNKDQIRPFVRDRLAYVDSMIIGG